MDFQVNRHSPVSLRDQIVTAIRERIAGGDLPPCARLLSSRDLAERLKVNRATVMQSYRDLQESGWIQSGVGRGTFVSTSPPGLEISQSSAANGRSPMDWSFAISGPRSCKQRTARNEQADLIPLNRAVSDTTLFPVELLHSMFQKTFREFGKKSLEYASPCGYEPLRETIKEMLARRGVDPGLNDVLIVNGSQQGLDLVARFLLRDGGTVLTSRPTFSGALDVFRWYGARVTGANVEVEGIDVEQAVTALKRSRPRLIYTIPTHHNPTGITLTEERRQQLLHAAQQFHVPILEDDWLGELGHPGTPRPIKAGDDSGHVLYLGTISKVLVPGLRVGWLAVPKSVFPEFARLKQTTDLATNLPAQMVLDQLLRQGSLPPHAARMREVLERRRELVDAAIDQDFPEEVRPLRPHRGMVLWIPLPEGLHSETIVEQARQHGLELTGGSPFLPPPQSSEGFRISYATAAEEQLQPAIRTLGGILKEQVALHPVDHGPPLV